MKTVLRQLGRFKRDTLLCIAMAALEVVMEILLPFITAIIIDQGLRRPICPLCTATASSWWCWPP